MVKQINLRKNKLVWDVRLGEWTSAVQERVVLTPVEVSIMLRMCVGMTAREIAADSNRALVTIHTHQTRIRKKLNARNDAQIGIYALASGFVDSEGNEKRSGRNPKAQ